MNSKSMNFKNTTHLLAFLLSATSLFAQQILFNEDFESLSPPVLPEDWQGVFVVGNSSFPNSFSGDTSDGLLRFESVASGNPGTALEIDGNLNFLSWTPESPHAWLQTFFTDDNRPSVFIGDDPDAYFQFDFDLFTSETQPVSVDAVIEWPNVGTFGVFGGGMIATLTNALPNEWQSHSVTYEVFEGQITHGGPHPQLINQDIEVRRFRLGISSEDWGNDTGNILRLDNVSISIVPEPHQALTFFILLIFLFFRIRCKKTRERNVLFRV